MEICAANQKVSEEVLEFIKHVGEVKEESITDFLVWRWRELDKRFNYLRVKQFNHHEESMLTGADFDMELWLVSNSYHLSLAVQAKKFIKPYDSYVNRLNYPNGSKAQMKKLLAHAASHGHIPFYFIYSIPESATTTTCVQQKKNGAIFIADAGRMEEFADGKHGKRVSRDQLLAATSPFYCMFCCPHAEDGGYFEYYFPNAQKISA